MEIGKLPNDILKKHIISKLNVNSKEILVGPGVGEDCSIIDFGEEVCVLTTDPITAAANNSGTIGVHICCNDIASAGVKPFGILVTILAPPTSCIEEIEGIMNEVNTACDELSIDVLGGHTEITDAVSRIVLSITAMGRGKKNKYVKTGGSSLGDDILVTGYAGLEGTAILSKDYSSYLSTKLNKAILARAQDMLKSISVVKVGLLSSEFGVSAMHDATEGGILGAIWEVAEASGYGAYIYRNEIPIKEETIQICRELNIDPFRLISSGSMIITCSNGSELCKYLEKNNIEARIVGKITQKNMVINTDGVEENIMPPEADEIYKVKI